MRVGPSLAVVLGALGVLAGFPLADPLVGLVITVAILFVLRGAARDIYHRLMDAIDPHVVETIERTLHASPGIAADAHERLLAEMPKLAAATLHVCPDGQSGHLRPAPDVR